MKYILILVLAFLSLTVVGQYEDPQEIRTNQTVVHYVGIPIVKSKDLIEPQKRKYVLDFSTLIPAALTFNNGLQQSGSAVGLQNFSGAGAGQYPTKTAGGLLTWLTPNNILTTSGNTITSNVNGIGVSTNIINSLSNSFNTSTNQITTTVNGISSSPISILPNFKTIETQSILGTGNIDLTKADVGLSNVDNTTDLLKPISTANQTALNLKQDKTSVATHSLIAGNTTTSQIIRINDQTLNSDLNVDNLFSVAPTKDATGKIILPTTTITSNNGLTTTASNTQLGGTLIQATNIAQGGFNLTTTGIGNVGFGTTTPISKLDVFGTTVSGGANNAKTALVNTSGGIGTYSLGNVLLGTTAIQAPVSVARFGLEGTVSVKQSPAMDIKIGTHTAGINGNTRADFALTNGNSTIPDVNVMTLLSNGNVGIGTTTPTATLDVAGSFKLVNGTQGANKILTSDATGLTSWQSNDFYRDGAKPNTIMTASGTITFSATNFLTWTNRLIILGGGRGTAAGILSANGYYDISVPPNGTVITTVGGATAITATAAGIPITQWGTLYYKLPSGGNASVPTNFIFVGFTADYTVTSDMVAVATYNQDNVSLRMGTGVTLRPNTNSINGSSAIAITAYTSTAVAIADATLPTGTMYTVTVAGAKQLYIK